MTLVEVIVAMAIVAAVSTAVASGFIAVVSISAETQTWTADAELIEQDIASPDVLPTNSVSDLSLPLGGFMINSQADTYTEGGRSYTVLSGSDQALPELLTFGDFNGTDPTLDPVKYGMAMDTTAAGGTTAFVVRQSGAYKLEVWGAAGGAGGWGANASNVWTNTPGGAGGYSVGTVTLQKGDLLYLYAGGKGSTGQNTLFVPGGYNGGGNGVARSNISDGNYYFKKGSGGGASDIRINSNSLFARVIVAGGGGGTNGVANSGESTSGGAGGGGEGQSATNRIATTDTGGKGGTESAGGPAGTYTSSETGQQPGSFGSGGSTGQSMIKYPAGAGGGGWYGGGAGTAGSSGGGGSGWIYTASSYSGWVNTTDKANWLLGTDYYLTYAYTYPGTWTSIPNPFNTLTMPGNPNGGFVRITHVT
ncbi:MAG: hypothetical protein LBC35_01640 [Coriobacteriales bacterium]|jgi:hypothetical protein|nr:hypothetical protein [Coriobacteriales bacterium]